MKFEAQILIEVEAALLPYQHLLRFWRQNVIAVKMGDRYVRAGLPGCADIIGLVKRIRYSADFSRFIGQFLAIEVKTPKGRQSKEQKAFEKMVRSMGGIYILVRSGEECIEKLKQEGVI